MKSFPYLLSLSFLLFMVAASVCVAQRQPTPAEIPDLNTARQIGGKIYDPGRGCFYKLNTLSQKDMDTLAEIGPRCEICRYWIAGTIRAQANSLACNAEVEAKEAAAKSAALAARKATADSVKTAMAASPACAQLEQDRAEADAVKAPDIVRLVKLVQAGDKANACPMMDKVAATIEKLRSDTAECSQFLRHTSNPAVVDRSIALMGQAQNLVATKNQFSQIRNFCER